MLLHARSDRGLVFGGFVAAPPLNLRVQRIAFDASRVPGCPLARGLPQTQSSRQVESALGHLLKHGYGSLLLPDDHRVFSSLL